MMSIFAFAFLFHTAFGCQNDEVCSPNNKVCIYDCPDKNKNYNPNFYGLGTDETKNFRVCELEPPTADTEKMCPEIETSERIKVGCKATLFNHFCNFECHDGFVSHPSLRYMDNTHTTGKVQCLKTKKFLATNLCVPVCADGDIPKNGVCGHGPIDEEGDDNGKCKKCEPTLFSKGLMPCAACPYEGTEVTSNNDNCKPTENPAPGKCKRSGLPGENAATEIDQGILLIGTITTTCKDEYSQVSSEISAVCYESGELSVQTVCSKKCRDPPKNSTFKTEGPFSYMTSFEYKCAEKTYVNGDTSMTEGSGVCDLDGLIVISGPCLEASEAMAVWKIALIAVFSIVGIVGGVILIFFAYKRMKN